MMLHIGLGFGLNEVYIMAGHWIYAIPIAIGFLLKSRTTAANPTALQQLFKGRIARSGTGATDIQRYSDYRIFLLS